MPPTTTQKTLSPAELAKLEHAFATDPASEAYRPLAEAYLGMGRFMEAMVVCKKGVKAHPSKPDPRVLLARVYAEQGKDKKALEELAGALQVAPNDKTALRLTGSLQLKGGEAEAGKNNLLKAFEADPADEDTLEAMTQYKVEAPKPAAPPPPPVAPPVLAPSNGYAANGAGAGNGASNYEPQVVMGQLEPDEGTVRRPMQPPQNVRGGPQSRPSAPTVVKRQPQRSSAAYDDEAPSESFEIPRRRKGNSFAMFVIMVVVVAGGLGGYYAYGHYVAVQNHEVNRLLRQAGDEIKSDTFASYEKAAKDAEAAIDKNPKSLEAHSYAAYAYVVRWGEHGVDERARAEEHLNEVRKSKGENKAQSLFLCADALFSYYSGKGAEALKTLSEQVEQIEAKGQRSAVIYLTLGFLQMQQGDLEKAKESMEKAQQLASDDPRVYATLGTLARRRGNDGEALRHFNTTLKYTRNAHPEALLGTALLILDQENPGPGYATASNYIKTLLESEPPPSPRELAMAHMVKAFLISRVSKDAPLYTDKDFQKKLYTETKVDPDPARAKQEVAKEEQAAMADQNNPELYLVRGKRLLYEENYVGAAEEIKKAISMNNSRAYYHSELAKALMRKEGGEKDAEDALRKALAIVPESPKLMTQLGQVLYAEKKVDEAADTYNKAIRDPKTRNPEAHFALGKIYDEKKDYPKAIEHYEKAANEFIGDSSMVAAAYDLEGLALDNKGDKQKSRDTLEKSLNADHDFDKAYCDYAKLLAKWNDPKDKDKIKATADAYLKIAPKGACATDMKNLGGAPPAAP